MITALKLLKAAEKRGWMFTVQGYDDDHDEMLTSATKAWEMVKDIEEANVAFYDSDSNYLGTAFLMAPSPISCAPEESIVDYTCARDEADNNAFTKLADAIIEEVV